MDRYVVFIIGIVVLLTVILQPEAKAETTAEQKTENTPARNPLSYESDKETAYAVVSDSGGNLYVAGQSHSRWGTPVRDFSGGAGDCFVVKLNDEGNQVWHTFLGGEGVDGCHAIVLDDNGNIYVAGESASQWAPSRRSFGGGSYDCFVAKLDGKGGLLWNTYLGGGKNDEGYALAVDENKNVFVAGNSADKWGTPINEHSGEDYDGFVAGIDKNGELLWNTFLGGKRYDGSYAIALDESGYIYIAGESFSEWGTPVNGFTVGYYGNYDAYVAKLNKNGFLLWNTFVGGTGSDYGRGIALGANGNIYVTGNSNIAWGKPLNPHRGDHDAYIVMLDKDGVPGWNTFIGGEGADYGRSITAYWTGNILVTGQSFSAWGEPVKAFSGTSDVFVGKLNKNGTLQWNTFLGEEGNGMGRSIEMDEVGNIYVAGRMTFRSDDDGKDHSGRLRAFAAKLNNAGEARWNNSLGN